MNTVKRISGVLFAAIWALSSSVQMQGQCDRVAWISSIEPGCGANAIDLDNGEVLVLTGLGASGLSGGQTVTFSGSYVPTPPQCAFSMFPVVNLNCLSDTLPCTADFGRVVDNVNPLRFTFSAEIYSGVSQQCLWDFGDGATASGAQVQHTFPSEGYYSVCLTVSDGFGCKTTVCKDVFVSEQNPGWCGYDVRLTAVGKRLFGKLEPLGSNSGALLSVNWYNSKTNQSLSQEAEFTHDLPNFGPYLFCVEYQVDNGDGTICSSTRCQQLTVAEPGCVMPQLAEPSVFCPSILSPVCGCDGITYGNECEAITAGLTSWWAGDCGSGGLGNCLADLGVELVSGSPDSGYTVRFTNLSQGDFNYTLLDFGDGTPMYESSQWSEIIHTYTEGGVYKSNLSVWKNSGCVSSYSRIIITDALHMQLGDLPESTDYVLPGDANGDRKANVYDLLNLGVGYFDAGSPRPHASTDWLPQFAPNWMYHTSAGVNYKHFDSDGNGSVNEFDVGPIEQHYQPIDTPKVSSVPDAPQVWLRFDQDTIELDPNEPVPVFTLGADVMVGSATQPALGLYGLAFALKYPEFIKHDPEVDFDDNSFLGSNLTMRLSRDIHSRRQLDMGIVRKNGLNASGYGRIARVNFVADFIIIVDVIDRATDKATPMSVPVLGLRAIDANGDTKILSVPAVQDTVWIKFKQTPSASNELELRNRSILVTPNPASDYTMVSSASGPISRIEVRNSLGQLMQATDCAPSLSHRLDTSGYPKGIYTLYVQTEKGMAEKRLAVQ